MARGAWTRSTANTWGSDVASSRLVMGLIVAALAVIVVGKLFFHVGVDPFLWLYGVLVTLVTFATFLGAYYYYKDPALDPPDPRVTNLTPKVSFVVPVKNEERLIRRCIESIVNQTYKNLEIVVMDDGSTDGTTDILKALKLELGIKAYRMRVNVGKKKAIEAAIRHTTGEIFAFVDSDSVLAPDAMERLVAAFNAHPDAGAVSAHRRALNAGKNPLTKIQDTWDEGQFRLSKGLESVYGAVTCASGCLSAFRREAIEPHIHAWANDRFLGKEFRFATDRTMTGHVLREHTTKEARDAPAAANGGAHEGPRRRGGLYFASAGRRAEGPATSEKVLPQPV